MKLEKTIPAGTYLCDMCGAEAPFVDIITGGDFCTIDGCVEGCSHDCVLREEIPEGFLPYMYDYVERYGGKTRNCINHLLPVSDCRDCQEGP